MRTCFKCDHPIDQAVCPICKWEGGDALADDSEAYVLLMSLVYRTLEEGKRLDDFLYQITVSDREMGMLNPGDQISINNAKWRITETNKEQQAFLLKAFNVLRLPGELFFEFSHDDPVDLIKKELLRWRDIRVALDEIYRLKKEGQLDHYLTQKTEAQRRHHRSLLQDESPYFGN